MDKMTRRRDIGLLYGRGSVLVQDNLGLLVGVSQIDCRVLHMERANGGEQKTHSTLYFHFRACHHRACHTAQTETVAFYGITAMETVAVGGTVERTVGVEQYAVLLV